MIIYQTNDFNWLEQKYSSKNVIFFVCIYKMVEEITKETWAKYSIQTLIYHNQEEKKKKEFWHKMSHIETQLEHSNIVLKRTRKYCGKKNKRHYRKRKTKI